MRTDIFIETDQAFLDDLEGRNGCEELGLGSQHEHSIFLDWLIVDSVVL
jgi:hypothetical protein